MATTFQLRPDGIMDPEGKYLNPLNGRPYTPQYFHHARRIGSNGNPEGWTTLTSWTNRMELFRKIHKYNIIIAILPPGTGKTVIVPKLLLHYFGYQKKVICTTPKTGTTANAGTYAAACLDVPIFAVDDKGIALENPNAKGKDKRIDTGNRVVGFKYSTEKRFADRNTLLLFTTDGTVKQTLLSGSDPNLSQYGGVIIDEVHERSINIDILVALLLDIIKRRPDFKVIFMSATINKDFFMEYFKRVNLAHTATVFELPGTQPLFKRILKPELKRVNPMTFTDVIFQKINEIIMNPASPPGDILAFITSESEAFKMVKRINANMAKYPMNGKPYPIAFTANTNKQDELIATGKNTLKTMVKPTAEAPYGFARKVIIGTNAVESSVTFSDDLVYVIDSGLAYEKRYDPKNYCYITGKFYVSQASIEQRCGRTGRTCDGTCLQLYTTDQFQQLKPYTDPKIILEDFTKDFLGIIALPMNGSLQKGMEFVNRMIEDPRNYQPSIKRAYENLINMDLIDSAGNLTPLGNICSNFGKFDIKIGKMCVGAYYLGCLPYAIMLGAILQTVQSLEDVFFKPPGMDEDRQLEQQYLDNLKRHSNPLGDHITLIALYIKWLYAPDPSAFAYQNGLNGKSFGDIQNAYGELYETVVKLKTEIKNLNLFKTRNEILVFGGGQDSNSHDDDSSSNSGDDSDDDIIPSDETIAELYGGSMIGSKWGDNFQFTNIDRNPQIASNFLARIESHHDNSTTTTTNISESHYPDNQTNIKNGGNISGAINNSNTADGNRVNISGIYSGGSQNYSQSKSQSKSLINSDDIIINSKCVSGCMPKEQSQSQSQTGGAKKAAQKAEKKAAEDENEKQGKMFKKIMDLISLKNLPVRDLTPFLALPDEERVLVALFYGYSNNLASWTGIGKKYNVKFSPEKASISKSSFDFLGKTPKMVVYNDFTMAKTQGRADDNKLGLISQLESKYIGVFLNLNEIKKQL